MQNYLYAVCGDAEHRLSWRSGDSLARALFRAGYYVGVPLCAGLGKCGRCRVRFLADPPEPLPAETRRLTPAQLADGVRLACLHPARGGERVAVDAAALPAPAYDRPGSATATVGEAGRLGLAVDCGTTGLAWRLLDLADGRTVAEGRGVNPQLGAGGEVVSRLAFALEPGGADLLRNLVVAVLAGIAARAGGKLAELCLAGNPAMVSILCGKPLEHLARAPYGLDWAGGEQAELGPGLPPAYIPPLFGPFVGADLAAGLTVLVRRGVAYPFLLADLGTNAELILGLDPHRYLAASAPLGPGPGRRGPVPGRPGRAGGGRGVLSHPGRSGSGALRRRPGRGGSAHRRSGVPVPGRAACGTGRA